MEKHATCQSSWNRKPTAPFKSGTWTWIHLARTKKIQSTELEKWKEKSYHSAKIYKERIKIWHDERIKPKEFKVGDKVMLLNSRVKLFRQGKLHSKWIGPYTIVDTFSHGAITLQTKNSKIFKVKGQRLSESLHFTIEFRVPFCFE